MLMTGATLRGQLCVLPDAIACEAKGCKAGMSTCEEPAARYLQNDLQEFRGAANIRLIGLRIA